MSKPKVLVVYYSRSGTTRQLARQVAESLDADFEEIQEPRSRAGVFGYMRSARDVLRMRDCPINPPRYDPALYDLVVIGTPVWVGRVSAPVQRYIRSFGDRCGRVAFFATYGGHADFPVLFGAMARACGQEPVASLAVKQVRLSDGAALPDVDHFATTIRTRLRLQALVQTEAWHVVGGIGPLRVANGLRGRRNRPGGLLRRHACAGR